MKNNACFFSEVYDVLLEKNLSEKLSKTRELYKNFNHNYYDINHNVEIYDLKDAGRPDRPELVSPQKVEKRKLSSKEGHIALIHSIAHIEFNAINLALDACYRFRNMPNEYYKNWLQVAYEEAYHFDLLNNHLSTLGATYGDLTAHNGLWDMAVRTADDVLVRMALVPRLMEARGLDVTPSIINKLEILGDIQAVEILKIILRDEIGHVKIGNDWFNYFCDQRNLNPQEIFADLLKNPKYEIPTLPKQMNVNARLQAGFSLEELNNFYKK